MHLQQGDILTRAEKQFQSKSLPQEAQKNLDKIALDAELQRVTLLVRGRGYDFIAGWVTILALRQVDPTLDRQSRQVSGDDMMDSHSKKKYLHGHGTAIFDKKTLMSLF